MGDFVRPEVIRLPLSGGRWIDVKKRLNAGEARKMFARVVKSMNAGERAQLDPELVGHTKLVSYVVGWSLTDDDGKPVPYTVDGLDNVDPDLYADMIAAVDQHEEAQEAARSAEKNETRNGAIASSVIGSLPSDAECVSSGSVS